MKQEKIKKKLEKVSFPNFKKIPSSEPKKNVKTISPPADNETPFENKNTSSVSTLLKLIQSDFSVKSSAKKRKLRNAYSVTDGFQETSITKKVKLIATSNDDFENVTEEVDVDALPYEETEDDNNIDAYQVHFSNEIQPSFGGLISDIEDGKWSIDHSVDEVFGNVAIYTVKKESDDIQSHPQIKFKKRLQDSWKSTNRGLNYTPMQESLLKTFGRYRDLMFTDVKRLEEFDIRRAY
ncbi:hypothetical protein HK096_001701, partial [Nowakowskiella sp. JEL0078]